MRTCDHGLPIGQCSCTADHCGKCGGEKDGEGWCANYCTEENDVAATNTPQPIVSE